MRLNRSVLDNPSSSKVLKKYKRLGCFVLWPILLLGLCWGLRVYRLIQPPSTFPLELKWQIDLGDSTYERPAHQNGLVFLPASSILGSYWYGIEATTGQIIWWERIARNNFRRCLTPDFLVLSGWSSLTILSVNSGDVSWRVNEAAYTVTCSEEVVFSSGAPRDSIQAFDLSTGQQIWNGTTPQKSFNGLVYNFNTDEIIARQSTLPDDYYVIDAKSGFLINSFEKVDIAPNDGDSGRGSMYLIDQGQLFINSTIIVLQRNVGGVG